jgi:hypothetical protein
VTDEQNGAVERKMCGCGHPVTAHFASTLPGIGFGESVCCESGCLCVRVLPRSGANVERYQRQLSDSERINALEQRVDNLEAVTLGRLK